MIVIAFLALLILLIDGCGGSNLQPVHPASHTVPSLRPSWCGDECFDAPGDSVCNLRHPTHSRITRAAFPNGTVFDDFEARKLCIINPPHHYSITITTTTTCSMGESASVDVRFDI